MESRIERELPKSQAGFRKGRGTRDHIANLRWIMVRQREYGQEVHLCFIDYSKAFDCVNHDLMWKTLREMGIPMHLITLLTQEPDSSGENGTRRNSKLSNKEGSKTGLYTITVPVHSICRKDNERGRI